MDNNNRSKTLQNQRHWPGRWTIERAGMCASPVGGVGLQLISSRVVNWISGVFKTGLISSYVAAVRSGLDSRVNSSKATSAQQCHVQYVPSPAAIGNIDRTVHSHLPCTDTDTETHSLSNRGVAEAYWSATGARTTVLLLAMCGKNKGNRNAVKKGLGRWSIQEI